MQCRSPLNAFNQRLSISFPTLFPAPGLSFQFPAGAGYASAAAHELNDDVAIPSNTNANANADRDGGEEEGGLKSSIRHSSRLQPEEAARRTKLGVDFISRYSLHRVKAYA